MEQNTPYPPLMRAPLKLRGVFGVSWQLYKRGFWPMFAMTMLTIGLLMLILMLSMFSMFQNTGLFGEMQKDFAQFGNIAAPSFNYDYDGDFPVGAVFSFMGIAMLVGLLMAFLIMPAYNGAVYLEMDQRMEGRAGTLHQLLKFALPIGLKRFYTTFLSLYVVQIGASIVMSMFSSVISVVLTFSTMFSFALHDTLTPGSIVLIALVGLITLFLGVVYAVFISLVYPVAAHENRRAFDAVFRAFKLSAKRFGRLLGAVLLYTVIVCLLGTVVVGVPILLLHQNMGVMFAVIGIVYTLWFALIMPYSAALNTALYVDSAARVDLTASRTPVPPVQPQHIQQAQPGFTQTTYPPQQDALYRQPPMPPHPEMHQPEAQVFVQPQPDAQPHPVVQPLPGVQPLPEGWVDTDAQRDDQPKQ